MHFFSVFHLMASNLPQMIPSISYTLPPKEFAQSLLNAATEYGFFYLTDSPMDWDLVDQIWKISHDFFLDANEHEKLASRDREGNTGYTALQEEKLDPNNNNIHQGDFKESFYLAQLSSTSHQVLPPPLEKDRKQLNAFFEACRSVCGVLLQSFARSIDLEDITYFSSKHTAIDDRLRLIHYPSIELNQENAGIRAGAHTDYGSITLLFQHQISGLQVWREKEKEWIDIPPRPNAIVVNIADALEFWTEGVMQSVQHRVVMPRKQDETNSRFSIAFFCHADPDAVLDPKPLQKYFKNIVPSRSQQDFQRELHRKGILSNSTPLTAGQHLQSRLRASYT